jgi:hypothetical protein
MRFAGVVPLARAISAHDSGEKDLFKLCFQMGSRIVAMETKQNRSFSGMNFAPQWVHST